MKRFFTILTTDREEQTSMYSVSVSMGVRFQVEW